MTDTITRSVKFPVSVSDEQYRPTINSIRLYRALARKAFSVCLLSEIAGSELEFKETIPILKPTKAAKDILSAAFDKVGKAHFYELRNWIFQESTDEGGAWMSFVWDSLRADVSSLWRSRDPHIPVTRGYLAMQGERGVAQFRLRGIGFPSQQKPKLEGNKITLNWDHTIGPVEFGVGKLDGGKYYIWKALRDNLPGISKGTTYLSERDGKLFIVISYNKEITKEKFPEDRELLVKFADKRDEFILISGPDKFNRETISAEEVCGVLEQIKIRRERWEARRAAAGNPNRPWGSTTGFRASQKVVERNTNHRSVFVQNRNHLITRRIINCAVRWNCGKIVVNPLPENWFGEPWQWAQFEQFAKYKAGEAGISIVFGSAL